MTEQKEDNIKVVEEKYISNVEEVINEGQPPIIATRQKVVNTRRQQTQMGTFLCEPEDVRIRKDKQSKGEW